jgi:hypothetical protein
VTVGLEWIGNLPFNAFRIPIFEEAGKGDSRPESVIPEQVANGENAAKVAVPLRQSVLP